MGHKDNNPLSIAYQELFTQRISFWSDKRYSGYFNANYFDTTEDLPSTVNQLLPGLAKRQNSLSAATNSTKSRADTIEQTANDYLKLGFLERLWWYFTEDPIAHYFELTELMTLHRLNAEYGKNNHPRAWAIYQDSILPKRTSVWDSITGGWRIQVQNEMSTLLNDIYQTLKTTALGVIETVFQQRQEGKTKRLAIKQAPQQEILSLKDLFAQALGALKTTTKDQTSQAATTTATSPAYQHLKSQTQKWQHFLEKDFLSKALQEKTDWMDKRIGYARDNKQPQQVWRFERRWRTHVQSHFTELKKNIKKASARTTPTIKYNALRKLVQSPHYNPKEQFGVLLEKYSEGLTVEQLNESKAQELADFCCYIEGMRQTYEAFVASYKTTCQQEALSSTSHTAERGVTAENEDKWSPKLAVKKAQLKDKGITHTWENDYAQYQKFLSLVMQRTEAIEWGVIWVEESLVEVRRHAKKEMAKLFHCLSLRYHPDKHKDSEELHSNRQTQLNDTKEKCQNELVAIATAPPPDWIKSQPYFEQLMQREDGVIKQTVNELEQKIEQQTQQAQRDTAELKEENKEIKERLERLEQLFKQSQEKQPNSQDKPKGQEKRSKQTSPRGGPGNGFFKDSQGTEHTTPQSPRAGEKKEDEVVNNGTSEDGIEALGESLQQ